MPVRAQTIELPKIDVVTNHYYVTQRFEDGTVLGACDEVPTVVPEQLEDAMDRCVWLGARALDAGNPPVGAVLLDHERDLLWEDITLDKSSRDLLGHAELRLYTGQAQPVVGNDLSRCTLVTTADLCNTCTAPYAEGKIGRIICGVPRTAVWALAGIMRPRKINMHELLLDGDIDTTVTRGLRAEDILKNFAIYGQRRREGTVYA